MHKRLKLAILAVTLGLLAVINFSVWQHERTLSDGETVILELAPVDPRSLMQGDYMALNFAMARQIQSQLADELPSAAVNYAVVELDDQRRARLITLDADHQLTANQVRLEYRLRGNRVQFATNAFFFQEGHAAIYEQAKYGLFKVNAQGGMLLARMLDQQLQPLGENILLKD